MSKVLDFIKKCKLPILWTIGYVFSVWMIMQFLFYFDIFNIQHWTKVSHAHLHGLGGLTFCIIVFAAVPLYIATTTIVARTQKLLITIPVPNFIKNILEKVFSKPAPVKEETKEESTESEPEHPTNEELSSVPAEMRGAFIRARTRVNKIPAPICGACSVNPNVYPGSDTKPAEPTNVPDDNLPLPPDFDFDETESAPTTPSAPVFQDINLYDDFDDIETSAEDDNNVVLKHFDATNRKYNVTDDEIIVTDTSAIAVHNDPEFWIMDDPMWFASGQTRVSPIQLLLETAEKNNITPVLFLGATNIMNFAEKCKEWKSKGIKVVTDLSEL